MMMKRVHFLLPVVAVVLLPACSSQSGKVRNGVYTPPDESFELRLPAGAKRGSVEDEFRSSGSVVGFEDGGGRSWRVERFAKNKHHISRNDPNLPLVTRLLFAESAWADSTGESARPLFERNAVTMKDGRQAVLTVRPAGGAGGKGLRGVLVFEAGDFVHVLGVLDEDLGRNDVIAMRGALVEVYGGLSFEEE